MNKAEEFINLMLEDEGWRKPTNIYSSSAECILCDKSFNKWSVYAKDGLCIECTKIMYPPKPTIKTTPTTAKSETLLPAELKDSPHPSGGTKEPGRSSDVDYIKNEHEDCMIKNWAMDSRRNPDIIDCDDDLTDDYDPNPWKNGMDL